MEAIRKRTRTCITGAVVSYNQTPLIHINPAWFITKWSPSFVFCSKTLAATNLDDEELSESMQKLLIVMQRLDQKIALLLESDGEHFNKRWGFLSRAGFWDKSHLMRQIEKYADIYTSRVSNFLHYTPFMYFRSQEQTLAHDSYSYYCSKIYGSAADDQVNSTL